MIVAATAPAGLSKLPSEAECGNVTECSKMTAVGCQMECS